MKAQNILTIKFVGNITDFDGITTKCEWNIEANPQESFRELASRFYKQSGLKPVDYKLYLGQKRMNNESLEPISKLGLLQNPLITLSSVELESCVFAGKGTSDYKIYIKFLQNNSNSAYNCNSDLNGLLKLCLLNEIALRIDEKSLETIKNYQNYNIIYYILKILKDSSLDLDPKTKVDENIKIIMSKKNGRNIINFSNFVDEKINTNVLQWILNFLNGNYLMQVNDIKFRLGKFVNYNTYFERELYKALQRSYFEFSVVSLCLIDREYFDTYEKEKQKCPNRVDKLLFHGTQIHPISCILTGMFRRSEYQCYQHGKGVYFTDCLDYCWFYGGEVNNRANMNTIPKIGDTFTAISSIVYYDRTKYMRVKNYKEREKPEKNAINFAYADAEFETVENPNFTKFVGNEYVVWDLDQICPFISVKFRREEYCVIWRDDNFSKNAVFNNEFDEIFKNFLKERLKYIRQAGKYNIYTFDNSEEALNMVRRKKYNKIILLSNVGPNRGGKQFVDKARKIIGNDVIVLFLAYNVDHLNWIKDYKNAIFSNDSKFYEEYLDSFSDKNKLKQLINKLQNHYHVQFNFDEKFDVFPNYKDKGKYSDITF